jgi:VWFA-related protein
VVTLPLSAAAAAGLVARQAQEPSFRAGVDVIEMDVSVLDKDRHPVRGLTAADFTVLENGKTQRIVSVSSVEAAQRDPVRSAWMRYATRDVVANDLADELGDGHLYAIVIDDLNLPIDDPDILLTARSAARHIVDLLGPSDRAAVVFAQDAGKTQDFTDDRTKLLDAIDRLQPHAPYSLDMMSGGVTSGAGDMAQRFSSVLGRSPCLRTEPVIPALDAVTARLATVPGGRKTLFYVGVGVGNAGGRGSCDGLITSMMRDIFRRAQRANINIHSIDPGGATGYRDYLDRGSAARDAEARMGDRRLPPGNLRALRDFMKTVADNTGGRAVIETDAIEPAIDRIFSEDDAYYLVGYETSNPSADGKFRKVEVTVDRPEVSVRTRSGYWAPEASGADVRRNDTAPSSNDLSMAGLMTPQGVPLRASIVPLAASATRPGWVDVGAVLTVRWPPLRAPTDDTLTLVRNIYDADGRPGPPTQETVPVTVRPSGGDQTRVDLLRRFALAPGRYQVRFNVRSAMLNQTGSLYADLEVPDLDRTALALSGIVIGSPLEDERPDDPWRGLTPLVPTTSRDFAPGDARQVFVRVFQGTAGPPVDVTTTVDIYDAHDASRSSTAVTTPAAAFAANGSADVSVPLALDRLTSGPYVLSVSATRSGGRKTRRDLVFRVR